MNEDLISRRALIETLDVMLVSCENHNLREALKEWAKHVPSVSCSEMPNSSGDLVSRQKEGYMTQKEIIDGLQFTIDMFLFDPSTGEVLQKHQLNEDNRTTVEACEEAIKLLKGGVWQYHPEDEPPEDDRHVLLNLKYCVPCVGNYVDEKWMLDDETEPISEVLGWWELPERPEG